MWMLVFERSSTFSTFCPMKVYFIASAATKVFLLVLFALEQSHSSNRTTLRGRGCYGLTTSTPPLSNNNNNNNNNHLKPVKRIAIIGSGISGLSVTHALINNVNRSYKNTAVGKQNNNSNSNGYDVIDLFDARTEFDHTAGAGIQLNGGLAVLGKINPTLQSAVYDAGVPQVQIESRTGTTGNPSRWLGGNNNNDDKNHLYDTLLQLDLQKVVQSAGGDIADWLLSPIAATAAATLTTHPDGKDTATENNSNSDVDKRTQQQKKLLWISIMRGALQRALYDALPSQAEIKWRLQFQKKLINLRAATTTPTTSSSTDDIDTVVYCQFDDGTESGPYDLVIGCEGINSIVKQYVESNGQLSAPTTTTTPTETASDTLTVKSAIYSGLRIRYAVADGDTNEPATTTAKLTQFFGNGAYALHGTYGAGRNQPATQCAFIVYLDDNYIGPFRRNSKKQQQKQQEEATKETTTITTTKTPTTTIGENADWTQDQRRTIEVARMNMLRQLETCQIPGAHDDVLRRTISKGNRFFELGSYYHNPFGSWSCTVPSPSLSSRNHAHVVLCGDAAHALPPFLGQGSNQAIQDAYCLVERIVEYNTRIENGEATVPLQSLLKDYQTRRWQPCFEIFWKAAFLGYLETGGIDGFYSKFRDVFFKSMGVIGVASKVLLNAATPKV